MVKFILELQEKATYGLSHKLKLTERKYNAVLNKAEAIADGSNTSDIFHWYEPHYTPSVPEQDTISKRNSSKTPTELQYTDLSVF